MHVCMMQARREVSELVSSMVEAGGGLPLPEDRLLTIMEAAQVSIPLLDAALPALVYDAKMLSYHITTVFTADNC